MARKIDLLALCGVLLVLLFTFGIMLFQNVWLALTVSSALSLAIVFLVCHMSRTKTKTSPSQFAMEITLKGNEYLINILKTTLKNDKFKSGTNYILLKNSAIFSFFKFGNVSSADVQNIRKSLDDSGISKVFIFANGIDKQAYKVATWLGLQIKLVKTSTLIRYLEKNDALPDFKRPRTKPSFQTVLATVFARGNSKAYAFSGTILVLTSFITPLKVYYIVSGTICLLLAIASLAFGNGSVSGTNIFKELKNAAREDCALTNNQIDNNATSEKRFCDNGGNACSACDDSSDGISSGDSHGSSDTPPSDSNRPDD